MGARWWTGSEWTSDRSKSLEFETSELARSEVKVKSLERMLELTPEEVNAIRTLRRAAKRLMKVWPKSLWLYVGDGSLNVMKQNELGEEAVDQFGGVDPTFVVDSYRKSEFPPIDGGGW